MNEAGMEGGDESLPCPVTSGFLLALQGGRDSGQAGLGKDQVGVPTARAPWSHLHGRVNVGHCYWGIPQSAG